MLERGASHYAAGRLTQAVEDWSGGLREEPEHPELHYNLGLALMLMGERADALNHWRKAAYLRPGFFEPSYCMVLAAVEQLKRNDCPEGWRSTRALCRHALKLPSPDPEYTAYLLHVLGTVEWKLGHRAVAIDRLKTAVETDPDNQDACDHLAKMLAETGRWYDGFDLTGSFVQPPLCDYARGRENIRRSRMLGFAALALMAGLFCLTTYRRD